MFRPFVKKLIENIPDELKRDKKKLKLDLILTGCYTFNVSFLTGALLFLKEMEERNYVKVCRISGNGLGAVAGLLYFCDSVNTLQDYNLETLPNLGFILKNKIPPKILKNKLFLSYYDASACLKINKSKFKSNDKLIDDVIKSCYLPLLVDGDVVYKNKYMDGLTPYLFDVKRDRQILYCCPFNYGNLRVSMNTCQETTCTSKVLCGLLDIHGFFITQQSSSMCSYFNDWSCCDKKIDFLKYVIERITVYIVYVVLIVKPWVPDYVSKRTTNLFSRLS